MGCGKDCAGRILLMSVAGFLVVTDFGGRRALTDSVQISFGVCGLTIELDLRCSALVRCFNQILMVSSFCWRLVGECSVSMGKVR